MKRFVYILPLVMAGSLVVLATNIAHQDAFADSSVAAKPFDDHTARAAYIAWVATDSAHESHTLRDFWERIEHDPHLGAYAGWLLVASMQHQRDEPSFRPDLSRAVDNLLESVEAHRDPNWVMPVLLWWQYRYADLLGDAHREQVRHLLLHEKYWITDPGKDQRCYFTENHQIIYHVNEYLAGHLFPGETFAVTGETGRWHHERARERIVQWMDWRARFGFSEFKAQGYSDVLLMILATLREFTPEPEMRNRADAMIDLILTGYALHTFGGNLAAPQGRGGAPHVVKGHEWMPSATGSILWGVGDHREVLSAGAIALALSDYEVPPVLQAIARDQQSPREFTEREGLEVEEAAAWGIDPAKDENIMFFWGNQQFTHPLVLEASMRALPWDGYYMAGEIRRVEAIYEKKIEEGRPLPADMDHTVDGLGAEQYAYRSALGRAEQYSYRTADYKLASVRDYRPGGRGFEHHVWQATLPGHAMAFSQNPVGKAPFGRPGYWKGDGILPRVAQHRNALIALHRIPEPPKAPSLARATHLYFPKWAFDEVRELDHWVIGRKGDGYLAVYSHQPAEWRKPDPAVIKAIHRFDEEARDLALASSYDWYAEGAQNVFICEMGSRAQHGSFEDFVQAIEQATVRVQGLDVMYQSPSLGKMEFGWDTDFRVAEAVIDLRTDYRIHSPYGSVRFGETEWHLKHEDWSCQFDLQTGLRRNAEN